MPLNEYNVHDDKFELGEVRHYSFPCCCCKYVNTHSDSEYPCRFCGHNANYVQDMTNERTN
jgi:rRNA maturation endonuclease Nob1